MTQHETRGSRWSGEPGDILAFHRPRTLDVRGDHAQAWLMTCPGLRPFICKNSNSYLLPNSMVSWSRS